MGLFGRDGVVGLELDTGIIRAVEMTGKNGNARVVAAGQVMIPDGAVSDGVVQDVDAVSGALQKLWSNAKIGSRNVVLGVFNQSVLMRLITFPKVPKDKLNAALRLQAGEYFPIPMSQMVLDFEVVGETKTEEGDMSEVLLVAAKKQQLEASLHALSKSRLLPLVVDATPLALVRVLTKEKLQGTVVMVDLGMGLSSIVLTVNGMPRFARVLPIFLRQYISGVSANLAVGEDFTGYVAVAAERGASDNEVFKRWGTSVASEIRASISYYVRQEQLSDVERVVLSGRGASISGLANLLQEELGIPCEVAHPAANVKIQGKLQVDLNGPEFAVSTGLALRGLEV